MSAHSSARDAQTFRLPHRDSYQKHLWGLMLRCAPPGIFRDFPNQLEAIASRVEAIAVKLILRCATPVCL